MPQLDPYLQWLGIRDPQRPVNHYRLLGVELFETDRNVIASAADRQMAHVRSFQSGQHADLTQKLLNELTAAKLCLLNPDRKLQYDQQLKQLVAAKSVATPTAATPVIVTASKPLVTKPSRSFTPWLILAGSVAVMIGLIVVISNKFSPDTSSDDLQVSASTSKTPDKPATKKTPPTKASSTNQQLVTTKVPVTEPVTTPKSTPTKVAPPTPTTEPIVTPRTTPTRIEPPLAKPQELPVIGELPTENSTDPTMKPDPTEPVVIAAKEPDNTPLVVAQLEPAKPAVAGPNKAALASKQKEIRDIFKDDYANRQPDKRIAFAKKLYDSALQQKDDPLTKYALFEEAKLLALQVGDVKIAMDSIDQQASLYNEDLGEEQINALISLQKLSNNRPPAYLQAIYEHCTKLQDSFAKADDYDSALKVANMAKAIAVKVDATAALNLQNQIKQLTQLKTLFAKAKVARDTLRQNPADAEANQTWGEFLCFAKDDFAKGLPFLANGTDDDLKRTIRTELANPTDTNAIVVLGDAWWELADKYKERSKILLRAHAADLYQTAMPKLSGLAAAKVEKRIKESEAETAGVRGNPADEQMKRNLMATTWTITWHAPAGTDVLKFLPNGKAENQAFVRWEVSNGELIIRAAENDTLKRYARIKQVNGQLVVNYFETGRTNTGVMKPNK